MNELTTDEISQISIALDTRILALKKRISEPGGEDPINKQWLTATEEAYKKIVPGSVVMIGHVGNDDPDIVAAAPELLAALQDLVEWAEIPDNGSKNAVIIRNAAHAAIAKAEGSK